MSATANEEARLAALRSYQILDTPAEERYDRIVRMAARLFGSPIALISLVDGDRQWFKASVGLEARQTPRAISFCAHAIEQDGVFVVPDAAADPRFAENPLVTGAPHVAFYAGAPLVTTDGHALGTVCVIDHQPWTGFPDYAREGLRDFATIVTDLLEARRSVRLLGDENLRLAAELAALSP